MQTSHGIISCLAQAGSTIQMDLSSTREDIMCKLSFTGMLDKLLCHIIRHL